MEITSYTNFRQNLKFFMDQVFTLKTPLFVTRAGAEEIVVMSKSEYNSIQETFHLLKSPKNAERLLDAITEYNNGGGESKELME